MTTPPTAPPSTIGSIDGPATVAQPSEPAPNAPNDSVCLDGTTELTFQPCGVTTTTTAAVGPPPRALPATGGSLTEAPFLGFIAVVLVLGLALDQWWRRRR